MIIPINVYVICKLSVRQKECCLFIWVYALRDLKHCFLWTYHVEQSRFLLTADVQSMVFICPPGDDVIWKFIVLQFKTDMTSDTSDIHRGNQEPRFTYYCSSDWS